MIPGEQNHPCPGPCGRCSHITLNDDLCDTCLYPMPTRKPPTRCKRCLRFTCGIACRRERALGLAAGRRAA